MTTRFIELAEDFWVAPQLTPEDVARAAALGLRTIVNNRPDREEPGQPAGAEIAEAARRAGLAYFFIPVGPAGITDAEMDRFEEAAAGAGPVLAFCRSGTRSATLRALAAARAGGDPEALLREAAEAGFNLAAAAPRMWALSRRRSDAG